MPTMSSASLSRTSSSVKTNIAKGKENFVVQRNWQKGIAADLSEKAEHFDLTLDVRGKRAEEALDIVDKYLDEAKLLSIKEVSILHGKGNGILRQLIRQYLNTVPNVLSARDEHVQFGGAGITVVELE